MRLTPPPQEVTTTVRGGQISKVAIYDVPTLTAESIVNIAATYNRERVFKLNKPPIMYANRYVTGKKLYSPSTIGSCLLTISFVI